MKPLTEGTASRNAATPAMTSRTALLMFAGGQFSAMFTPFTVTFALAVVDHVR
jgi:hypothetical protein